MVNLNGSTITGGTLTTTSGGTIQNNGSATLDGSTNVPTISGGSTVTLLNNIDHVPRGGTITNNGTIVQNSTGSDTDIRLTGNTLLTGDGNLTMSNSSDNRIFGNTTWIYAHQRRGTTDDPGRRSDRDQQRRPRLHACQ